MLSKFIVVLAAATSTHASVCYSPPLFSITPSQKDCFSGTGRYSSQDGSVFVSDPGCSLSSFPLDFPCSYPGIGITGKNPQVFSVRGCSALTSDVPVRSSALGLKDVGNTAEYSLEFWISGGEFFSEIDLLRVNPLKVTTLNPFPVGGYSHFLSVFYNQYFLFYGSSDYSTGNFPGPFVNVIFGNVRKFIYFSLRRYSNSTYLFSTGEKGGTLVSFSTNIGSQNFSFANDPGSFLHLIHYFDAPLDAGDSKDINAWMYSFAYFDSVISDKQVAQRFQTSFPVIYPSAKDAFFTMLQNGTLNVNLTSSTYDATGSSLSVTILSLPSKGNLAGNVYSLDDPYVFTMSPGDVCSASKSYTSFTFQSRRIATGEVSVVARAYICVTDTPDPPVGVPLLVDKSPVAKNTTFTLQVKDKDSDYPANSIYDDFTRIGFAEMYSPYGDLYLADCATKVETCSQYSAPYTFCFRATSVGPAVFHFKFRDSAQESTKWANVTILATPPIGGVDFSVTVPELIQSQITLPAIDYLGLFSAFTFSISKYPPGSVIVVGTQARYTPPVGFLNQFRDGGTRSRDGSSLPCATNCGEYFEYLVHAGSFVSAPYRVTVTVVSTLSASVLVTPDAFTYVGPVEKVSFSLLDYDFGDFYVRITAETSVGTVSVDPVASNDLVFETLCSFTYAGGCKRIGVWGPPSLVNETLKNLLVQVGDASGSIETLKVSLYKAAPNGTSDSSFTSNPPDSTGTVKFTLPPSDSSALSIILRIISYIIIISVLGCFVSGTAAFNWFIIKVRVILGVIRYLFGSVSNLLFCCCCCCRRKKVTPEDQLRKAFSNVTAKFE